MKKIIVSTLFFFAITSNAADFPLPDKDYCSGNDDCLLLEDKLIQGQKDLIDSYKSELSLYVDVLGRLEKEDLKTASPAKHYSKALKKSHESWVQFIKDDCKLELFPSLITLSGSSYPARHKRVAYTKSISCIVSRLESRVAYMAGKNEPHGSEYYGR
ncbi:MAG: hypothetical protein COA83_09935 [Methylophaga sp.]|nr:MAG: hypothetical protein COA83_09935 [Methylophaga sp.]